MRVSTEEFIYHVCFESETELLKFEHLVPIEHYDKPQAIAELMHDWCNETFGDDQWDYSFIEDPKIEDVFKFKTEKDRTMFLLKWG